MSTALATMTRKEFTEEEQKLIRAVVPGCGKLSENEMQFYLHVAAENHLDPLMREIYALSIWDPDSQSMKLSIGIGLDGHRRRAAETGCYAPGKITFRYDEAGNLIAGQATVKVWHPESRTWIEVEGQELLLEECIQRKKQTEQEKRQGIPGQPTKFWLNTPRRQLGKCCEVDAIRRAFPRQTPRLAYHEAGEVVMPAEEYPDAIDIPAENITEVPDVAPPPVPEGEKRGRGRPRKHAETLPTTPPDFVCSRPEPVSGEVKTVGGEREPINPEWKDPQPAPTPAQVPTAGTIPAPPAAPGRPYDGVEGRGRIVALAARIDKEMSEQSVQGAVTPLLPRLKAGCGLPMSWAQCTPEFEAKLVEAMEREAMALGWAKPAEEGF